MALIVKKEKEVEEVKETKTRRYTEIERKALLAKYHALREKGTSALEAAKKIDMTYITLRLWEKQKEEPQVVHAKPKVKRHHRVKNALAQCTGRIEIVLTNGVKIMCDAAQAPQLLSALSH